MQIQNKKSYFRGFDFLLFLGIKSESNQFYNPQGRFNELASRQSYEYFYDPADELFQQRWTVEITTIRVVETFYLFNWNPACEQATDGPQ